MSTTQHSTATIEPSETADRARAYVALIGMVSFEVDPQTLGSCIESWALFMSGSDVSRPALVATLRAIRERCPIVSLLRACVTLGIDVDDVMADD